MNKEKVEKKSKAVPWGLIVITIILIIIPIIFKIISIQNFNKPSNLPKTGYAYADGAGTIVYFLMGFAMHSLAMWSLVINLVIIFVVWMIYFIKRRKSKNNCIKDNSNYEKQ